MLLLAVVTSGCSVATQAAGTSTIPALPVGSTTTIAATTTTLPDVEGYVVDVLNGHTFDLQIDRNTVTRFTLGTITVPDIGTCEGAEARSLLASIIFGHKVRVSPDGTVWRGDVDAALTLVSYGRAKATGTRYATEDAASIDFTCVATTTTEAPVLVVVTPKPKPKPTTPARPKPKPTVVRTTVEDTVEDTPEPVPAATAPPVAEPRIDPPQPPQVTENITDDTGKRKGKGKGRPPHP